MLPPGRRGFSLSDRLSNMAPPIAPWTPLLEARLRDEALRVVHCLLEAPRKKPPRANGSLADGAAGLSLLYAYAAQLGQRAELASVAEGLLEESMDAAASGTPRLGLFEGLAGVGFAIEHLNGRILSVDADVNDALDEALLAALSRPEPQSHDLAKGLAGYGLYALERAPRGASLDCLTKIVAVLESQARPQGEGCAWLTPPEGLNAPMRSFFPRGLYDLGVPHGAPGVIAFLGRASALRVAGASSLLGRAVLWVLGRRAPDAEGAFPRCVAEGARQRGKNGRTWCYGDPGVGLALLVASRAAQGDWEAQALDVLRGAAERCSAAPPQDTGLCCGSAGLAHIFNRVHHLTREETFARSARSLFAHAVEGAQRTLAAADGAAGPARPRPVGMLSGLGGTALALLAASSDLEPAWDKALVMSG